MSDLRKAAEMALEALKSIRAWPETREALHQTQAIEALRQALAQPSDSVEHEPWCDSVTKLLTSLPPQVPPCNCKPKREWVGLTDEDRREFAAAQYGWEDLLAAADAKLKEKNNGDS